MIEAQQRNWKPDLRTIGIEHDRGPTMMRAVIAKLLRDDDRDPVAESEMQSSLAGAYASND
jgi:hypothetical protein